TDFGLVCFLGTEIDEYSRSLHLLPLVSVKQQQEQCVLSRTKRQKRYRVSVRVSDYTSISWYPPGKPGEPKRFLLLWEQFASDSCATRSAVCSAKKRASILLFCG